MPIQLEAGHRVETVQWAPPQFESSPDARVAWVEDMIQEGEGFLENQTCYKNLSQNLRVFDAMMRADKTRSTLVTNELKYDIRKFCETLSEVREIAGYSSDIPAYKGIAEMLTKVAKAVYLESDFPSQILKVLQYASVMGIGYLWPKVKADEYGYGERQLVFEALGLLDVVPVQVPKSNDVQDAYAVTVYDYMPIAEATGRFPLFANQLKTVGRLNYKNRMQARRQDYNEMYRYGEQGRSFGNLYCEMRYTFVRDMRINTTGYELPMGDPGTTWFYKVPSVGQDIFGGMKGSLPWFRKAMVEDCRVYPNLRLIITSSGIDRPLYDGPAFDWDTKIPIIQYTVDDWAWEPLGRSLVGDVAPIEITTRKLERKMDQVITTTLNPPLGYNMTETGGPKIEHFDMFEEDVRIGLDGLPKGTLQSVLPDEVRVTAVHFQMLEYLKTARETQLGLQDLGTLQNIKMQIASDTAEKMLESIGPIAKGIAARIEKSNKAVGNRVKFLILQWFNVKRIMEYVGPNIAMEVFDYDPDSLVPSHMPDEMNNNQIPDSPSMYSRLARARWFAKSIRLTSVPNTLLKITQMQRQLMMLQLKRTDAPISWATVMKDLDIPNWGESEGLTEKEKWFNEQIEMQKMKLLAAAAAQALMAKLGLQPPGAPDQGGGGGGSPASAAAGGGGTPGAAPSTQPPTGQHGGARPGAGRKPTAQAPPKIEQKGGAGGTPRTTIAESR